MFKNFCMELLPRAVGNGYENMKTVIFEREYVIVVCL
jgi:hypothetical protein